MRTLFKDYAKVMNRVYMAEFIDERQFERQRPFRASLVANPVTGDFYSTSEAVVLPTAPTR